MHRKRTNLLNLLLALALLLTIAQAGWFGSSEEEPKRGRRRYGDEPEGPEAEPTVGDYKGSASNDARRDRLAEMKKNRTAKDRDEMMSE